MSKRNKKWKGNMQRNWRETNSDVGNGWRKWQIREARTEKERGKPTLQRAKKTLEIIGSHLQWHVVANCMRSPEDESRFHLIYYIKLFNLRNTEQQHYYILTQQSVGFVYFKWNSNFRLELSTHIHPTIKNFIYTHTNMNISYLLCALINT